MAQQNTQVSMQGELRCELASCAWNTRRPITVACAPHRSHGLLPKSPVSLRLPEYAYRSASHVLHPRTQSFGPKATRKTMQLCHTTASLLNRHAYKLFPDPDLAPNTTASGLMPQHLFPFVTHSFVARTLVAWSSFDEAQTGKVGMTRPVVRHT